jgi:hypothetical protein
MATKNEEKTVIRRITDEEKRVYHSLDEAQASRPEGRENWTLFQVSTKDGKMRWLWAPYYERALWWIDDVERYYSITAMEDLPSKADVASYLAALPEKDRAELLAQYGKKK